MTVQEPPPHLLYDVQIDIPGDADKVTVEDLRKKILAKASEGLRQRCSGLSVTAAPVRAPWSEMACVQARVNEWTAANAVMRVATLIAVRAGEGWDRRGMRVHSEPAQPRSSCCRAPVRVEGDATQFWRCEACGAACDILPV